MRATLNKISRFLLEPRGKSVATTAKVVCNKLVYAANLVAGRDFVKGRLRAPWHWYRYPFSLRGQTLWSSGLRSWFWAADESALECMLHMEEYEPVDWVAPRVGEIVLDVGGYIGWYTIHAAKRVGARGQVVVLEPDEQNRRQLERNLQLNNIQNVQVLPMAVWSSSGSVSWQHGDEPVWHRVVQSVTDQCRKAVSIDDLVDELGLNRLDWIKMDIEGGEIAALQGALQTLRRHRPTLFIEVHETKESVGKILEHCGYRVECERYDQSPDKHGWMLFKAQ